ncbi:MAG: hypothetical protein A4E57_04800 [Syntrophorhabdaceae bacterium PtaU1.Bin034]|jgi:hypothetical protein|nr:MAG: hypothetical protein A4E57_04800 [Syntrophorhabdaceae bacterium PtaU1.Bin034]
MIPKDELARAIELAKKYRVGKLYVVGSSLKDPETARDYDFAVSDVPEGAFFLFYGELFMSMSKNVDLIDLSGSPSKFKSLVLREGKLVYDKEAA